MYGISMFCGQAHLQPQSEFQPKSCRFPVETPTMGQRLQLSSAALWGRTYSWRNNMAFQFFIMYSLPHCIRWAVILICIKWAKGRCKKLDVEQSVHRKTSPKPLVVRGCLKPSRIMFISLPNPISYLFFGSGFGFRFHPFTVSITQYVRGMWWLSMPGVCFKLWVESVVQNNC